MLNTNRSVEIELRWGNYYGDGQFNPKLRPDEWLEAKNLFDSEPTLTREDVQRYYILYDYNRKIICWDKKCKKGEIVKKLKKENKEYPKYNIRISRAIEETKEIEIYKNIKFTKRRERYTYTDIQGRYKIDISKDYIYSTKKYDYFIEFEVIEGDSIKSMFKESIEFRKLTLDNVRMRLQIIMEFNNYINVRKKYTNIQRDLKSLPHLRPKLVMNKPVNLPRSKIAFLRNYVFLPKLDGVHYFIFYTSRGVWWINEKDCKRVGEPVDDFVGSIFLAEVLDSTAWVYDVLWYRGVDVRPEIYSARLEFIMGDPELSVISLFENVCDVHTELPNDGIICHPNIPYNDKSLKVYKWKYPELLTIDFHVRHLRDNIYGLLVYNNDRELVKFLGVDRIPFSGEVELDNEEYDEMIVEFRWERDMMVPERIRWDKVLPNYVDVAQNVWKDIHNPIDRDELCGIDIDGVSDEINDDHSKVLDMRVDYFDLFMQEIKDNYNRQGNSLFDYMKEFV